MIKKQLLSYFILFLVLLTKFSGVNGQINTGSPIIPFGSNTVYAGGLLPTNLPSTGIYGKSTDAASAYNTWKTNYVVACGSQYRVKFDDPNKTVSEGIGYGMLLAAYAADKNLFDGLWSYYKSNSNGNGAMDWLINGCSGVGQAGGASDAELDAAAALLVAATQWPLGSTYQADAVTLINTIQNKEMDASTHQIRNGDGWNTGLDCRNPSYHAPAYFRAFATAVPGQASFWNAAATAAYDLITKNANSTTGLVSDWCNAAGATSACQNNSTSGLYGYDACRNPWRMATDVAWYGNSTAATGQSQCNKIATYISGKGATSVGGPVAQSGGSGGHYATFVSTFAAGCVGSTNQSILDQMYSQAVGVSDVYQNAQPTGYFGNTLRCISLFTLTGNFWKPGSSPTQEINVQQAGANIPSGSTYDLGNIQISKTIDYTFTIQNLGATALTIGPGAITFSGPFTLVTAPSASIPANSTSNLVVRLTAPGSAGAITGSITIPNNDANEGSYVINLKATATTGTTAPVVSVDYKGTVITNNSSTYSLGNITQSQAAGNVVGLYTFTISNTGSANLSVSNITASGTGYTMYQAPSFPAVVNSPTGTVNFTIQVTANTATGAQNGTVTITNTSGLPSYVLNLTLNVINCTTSMSSTLFLDDYEGNVNVLKVTNPTGTPFNEAFANPAINATNPSFVCMLYTRMATGVYDQIRYKPSCGGTFNTTIKKGISMLVYSPAPGIPIVISTKTSASVGIADLKAVTTKTGAWEKLFFDLAPVAGLTTVAYLDIQVDPTPAPGVQRTFYFDDIKYEDPACITDLPSSQVFMDYDAHRNLSLLWLYTGTSTLNEVTTNPSATGLNTSATVAKFVRSTATGSTNTQGWRYVGCQQQFDFSNKTTVSMLVYSGKAGIPISMSFVPASGTAVGVTVNTTVANTWERLYFDFSALAGNTTMGFMDIAPDPLGANLTALTYYFDDIKYDVMPCTNPGAAGTITGSATACSGETGSIYSVPAVSGATGYTWSVPSGAIITAGANTNSITVTFASTGGNITVTPTNTCGSGTISAAKTITITAGAGAAGTITGSTAVCSGQTGVVYNVAAVTGATGYSWTVPTGASITAGANTNSITVTFGSTVGSVSVIPTSTCGNGASSSLPITFGASAGAAGTISGPGSVCSGATAQVYSITSVTGATGYNWTVPTGASITAGANTNSITVTFGSTGGSVSVIPTGTCGNGASSSLPVTIGTAAGAAGTISGPGSVCSGATAQVYSITSVTGATGYNWTVPTGASITAGTNTNSITVTFGSTGGSVSVIPTGTCGNGASSTLPVTINGTANPAGTITGSATACSGQIGVIYSISAVTGATGYNWTVPTGATITAGANTTSITVTFGTTGGSVSVIPTSTCGNGASSSLTVAISGTANPAGTITGSGTVCSGATGKVYSISAVTGATGYNWTVPTGATLTAGANTTSITVSFGTTGGSVSVIPTGTCGNGASSSLPITIGTVASAAGTITGSGTVCSGAAGQVYSISAVTGATGYNWTVPTGATITAGANTTSITVTFGTTGGSVSVIPTSTCGNGASSSLTVAISGTANPAGTISGPGSVCSGATGQVYSISAVTGATGYNWTVPTGATITAGANTTSITVTFGTTGGSVSVIPTSTCGNGASSSLPIAISGTANPAGTISGPGSVCSGATGQVYSITAVTGATGYNWTVPTGASITAGANTTSITVTFGSTAGSVSVIPTSTCGNGASSSLPVAIGTSAGAAGTITGPGTVCSGSTGKVYSIAVVTGATGYNWTVPTGASITAGANTTDITVTFGSTAGSVSVIPTNTCGNGASSSLSVVIGTSAGAAGTITGAGTVCSGSTGQVYSIAAVTGATGYNWTVPTGASITAGANTTSITVTFGSNAGSVSVIPTGTCGNGASSSLPVAISGTANPAGIISGPSSVCSGATAQVYSIAAVTGATGYNWTVPTGASITAGANTTSITVTFGSNSGSVSVIPTGTCGNGASSSLPVSIGTSAGAAGTISGPGSVCSGSTGKAYSIPSVTGATGYNWTVPTGASITAGANTNSITVTFGSTAGSVSVIPTGTCGNGTSSSLPVTISGTANPAGTISGAGTVCNGSTGQVYSIAAVTGATGYNWTVPTGASITAGANTTSITVTFGTTAGSVSVVPTNTCGNGASSSLPVTLSGTANPAGTISGPGSVCSGATAQVYSIAAVTGATGYNWTVPTGASITAGANTTSITVTFGSTAGSVSVIPTGTCGNGASSSLPVNIGTAAGAAGTISGPGSVCSGSTGKVFSIAAVTGATGYNWTVPTGANITAGVNTTSITVTFGSTAGSVSVIPTGTCGNGASSSLPVTISGAANPAGTITGSGTVCSGATGQVYSIAAVTGATGYNWTVPTGSSITAGANTTSITVTFGSIAGSISVIPTSTCGNGASSSLPIAISGTANPAGTISGPGSVCSGATGQVYSIAAVTGATGYNWTVPTGASITAGANTRSITVTFGSTAGSISVIPTGTCGNGASSSLPVSLGTTGAAGTISGAGTVCSGSSGNIYSISSVTGATGYNWTVPTGASITAGANTASITVTFGANAGTISVIPTNTCGNGASSSLSVAIGTATSASIVISCTSANICAGVPLTFNAYPQNGGSSPTYLWKLNNVNTGTNSSVYSATLGGGDVVTCRLTSGLACAGAPVTSNQLIVQAAGTSPCAGGTAIVGGPSTVNANQTQVTYFVNNPVSGVTYTWAVPQGSTITSTGANGTSIIVDLGHQSGSISVTGKDVSGNIVSTGNLPLNMSGATAISFGNAGTDTYSAYPTPFTEEAVININSNLNTSISIKVIDSKGIIVYTSEGYATNQDISIGKDLSGGVYLVQVTYQNRIQVIKLVKI